MLKIFKSLNLYSSRSDTENIFMHVLNISLEDLILNDLFITEDQKNEHDVQKALENLLHILLVRKHFMNMNLKLLSDTLIPRNETEILVNAVEEIKNK